MQLLSTTKKTKYQRQKSIENTHLVMLKAAVALSSKGKRAPATSIPTKTTYQIIKSTQAVYFKTSLRINPYF